MKLCGIGLLLMMSIITRFSWAQAAPEHLVIVRPEGSWPPWEIAMEGEPLKGIHIEMIETVADSLGITLSVQTYPWKRAIAMLSTGRADAITYMSKTPEREEFGYFEEGNILSLAPIGFFVLKENQQHITFTGDLRSLQPYTIGTCRGYSYHESFDNAAYLIKDDGAADENILVKKLIAGRVKVAIGYVDDVKYHARQMGLEDRIVFLEPHLSDGRPTYLVFSKAKHHSALAKRFAMAMMAYKSSPAYRELLTKYGLKPQPLPQ